MTTIQPGKTLIREPEDIKRECPTSKPVVQYIRQSTKKQVKKNKQSTKLQDEDLSRKLTRLGYDRIIKIDDDQGKSGQKRRDERAGLDRLLRVVENGEVGSVAAFDASRLYRDLTRVNYMAFVHMCETYHIPVITYARTFWPDSSNDMDALIEEFKRAAKYIEEQIEGKLLPAKARAIEIGVSYGGNVVPIGFTIAENEDRKHYQVYEPHAEKVRAIYRRYRELDGNLARLGRELRDTGFKFPAFSGDVEKVPNIGLKWDGSGYPIRSRTGLIGILTNVAYIGWYLYDGVLVSNEAHDSIVPMDDFMYAYSRLSPTTLDGEPNENRPKQEHRYGLACEALLDGILESDGNPVYAMAYKDSYVARVEADAWSKTNSHIQIKTLDNAVGDVLPMLLASLKLRHRLGIEDELHQQIANMQKQKKQEITSLDEQLENIGKAIREAELEKRIAREEESEQGIREAIKDLKRLNVAKTAIEAKVQQAGNEVQELEEAGSLLEQAVNDWEGMKFSQKRRFVRLVIERANVVEASPYFVKLELFMKAPLSGAVTGHIYRNSGKNTEWTGKEESIIKEMYPYKDRRKVLEALPNRTWESIRRRAGTLPRPVVRRTKLNTATDIPNNLTYADVALMKELGIADTKRSHWAPCAEHAH